MKKIKNDKFIQKNLLDPFENFENLNSFLQM